MSVTMGKRTRFSLFVYSQNTGTRFSVDISRSYMTVKGSDVIIRSENETFRDE